MATEREGRCAVQHPVLRRDQGVQRESRVKLAALAMGWNA
ncbi:hypothetical protein BDI4_990004 [Burkholderia diffusa]|nr:hypothetical protein BDI4_990004 [Burkholderia diffusa]